jgi:Zn finger protein HypA/HybF involved in hydrogenase expression
MITIKQLKKLIERTNDEAIVMLYTGEDITHIHDDGERLLLSAKKPLGECNRCGEYVYESIVDGYTAYCPSCNEDLYKIEFKKVVK